MVDKKQLSREFILKNPNLSATEALSQAKALGISIRKTDFLKEYREANNLPEPSLAKREASIPVKHRTVKQKASIKARVRAVKVKPTPKRKPRQLKLPTKIPFEQTKFGKIVRDLQKVRNITEKKAIIHARKLLKIDKADYNKINQKDVQILLAHTP